MKTIHLIPSSPPKTVELNITGSKSESNRALIIKANSSTPITIINLSTARDTVTLNRLLNEHSHTKDVMDAGTTMRFLLAHYAIRKETIVLTGTERMQQRPIEILVQALNQLGCNITYNHKTGFPPLTVHPYQGQKLEMITVRSDISSQYISALLMIAPRLEMGLTIQLEGKASSRPYIEMTISLMEKAGVSVERLNNGFRIDAQSYQSTEISIEPDWSGASYWYSICTISGEIKISIPGLKDDSFQGDRVIARIMENLGVKTSFDATGVRLEPQKHYLKHFGWDFSDCPDLFQTIAVVCAVKGIKGNFTGLESLRIKETDRLLALQKELRKINTTLEDKGEGLWSLTPGNMPESGILDIETYEDHRMAMAFAPIGLVREVTIQNPEVIDKSYPEFWSELKKTGIRIQSN